MNNLHGILEDGKIIKGLKVLSYSYELVKLGWIYYPTKLPLLSSFLNLIYKLWAKYRLKITGREEVNKFCEINCKQLK